MTMDAAIPFFSFEGLSGQEGFRHGTSPRTYCPEPGHAQLFDPLAGLSPGECTGHGRLLLETLGIGPSSVNRLKQVHGDCVITVDAAGMTEEMEGDALITSEPGCALGVVTADCVPVILCDPVTRSLGAVHAGRMGTQQSILEKTIHRMREVFGVAPESLLVGLGPAIGPCCYEVEEECARPFRENFADGESFVKPHTAGKVLLDLWAANRSQALAAGVPESQVFLSGECTACNSDRWHSYRKEGSKVGRMLTVAMWE